MTCKEEYFFFLARLYLSCFEFLSALTVCQKQTFISQESHSLQFEPGVNYLFNCLMDTGILRQRVSDGLITYCDDESTIIPKDISCI